MASVDTLVIGTAGHIDHGKTTLVKALTGVDLDTLPEEKERGITIALGFAPLTLENGDVIGFVDVPGHERLIRTMVAGASGLDAVLLCVSAVEGVMPQTREHLDILGLLGVRSGILVVTMADLVDPELLELATEEIREQVTGTFLEGARTVVVSALTGLGIGELKSLLGRLPRRDRPTGGPFRLPVDRSFARKGFGTVATGTAWSGRAEDGSEIEIAPSGRRARLRGVQVHGIRVGAATAGSRTALNLAGIDVDDVPRGSWLVSPGAVAATQVVDVSVRWVGAPVGDDGDERAVVLLHGTAEIAAKLIVLGSGGLPDPAPGATSTQAGREPTRAASAPHVLAQLRLAEPIACLPGDRFVIRQASPSRTLGGGVVLDPWFAVARRARAVEDAPVLAALAAGEPGAWLRRAGARGIDRVLADQLGCTGALIADRVYDPQVAETLHQAVLRTLAQVHAEHPLSPSVNRREVHRGPLRALDDRGFLAVLEEALATGDVVSTPTGIRLRSWTVPLTDAQVAWTTDVAGLAANSGYNGLGDLPPHPDASALLHLLRDRGQIERIGDRWYSTAVLQTLSAAVRQFLRTTPTMDPAAFKEISGQSRRTAIPLLEWLDQTGVTQRAGDTRVLKGA